MIIFTYVIAGLAAVLFISYFFDFRSDSVEDIALNTAIFIFWPIALCVLLVYFLGKKTKFH